MELPELVAVYWQDSRQPTSQWQWLRQYNPQAAVHCVTVGWLISDGDGVKAVAQSIGDCQSDDWQVSGVAHIPDCCIEKMVYLRKLKVS